MAGDPPLRNVVVLVQQLSPSVIADAEVRLGRRNDVSEQYGREQPVGRRLRRVAGEERNRLWEQTLGMPVSVTRSLELDELRDREVLGEPASELDWQKRVALCVHNERGNRERRQYTAHIDREVGSHDLPDHLRRTRVALITRDDRLRLGWDVLHD